jgi:predicted RNA-binding Zn ribbon-like protein
MSSEESNRLDFAPIHSQRRPRHPLRARRQPIAEVLAKLLAEEDPSDVKACEGAICTLMFADRTRGRSRRWCGMEICGNRAKQINHRRRLKMSR